MTTIEIDDVPWLSPPADGDESAMALPISARKVMESLSETEIRQALEQDLLTTVVAGGSRCTVADLQRAWNQRGTR